MNLLDIDALIKKADELQPLPASVVKLASLLSGTEANVDEVSDVIRLDPTLTVRLLRMANSAFSGASMEITTVQEAVSRLGTRRILSLAVASHSRPLMQTQLKGYGYEVGQLWRHSVISMLVAELAPRVCRVAVPQAAPTAALLHDVGKLVMASFLDPTILRLLVQAQKEGGLSPMEAEAQVLQVHHAELGGLIARHWNLPEIIVTGITYHHTPEQGLDIICDVVHLANIVAKNVEAKMANKRAEAVVDKGSAERLGLRPDGLEVLCDQSIASFSKVASLFGVE